MSVVIIGGNDRMHSQYKAVCSKYNYKAKIFTQMTSNLKERIGKPDLLILFTDTVSHKMVVAEKNNISVEISHSGSCAALNRIFEHIIA